MVADLYRHFLVEPLEEIQQFVCCEAAKMTVHQVRYVRLCNSQNTGYFSLLELFVFQNTAPLALGEVRGFQKGVCL